MLFIFYKQNTGTHQNLEFFSRVGVVGMPNVGKSSLINSLKRARACTVGATPGKIYACTVSSTPGIIYACTASATPGKIYAYTVSAISGEIYACTVGPWCNTR